MDGDQMRSQTLVEEVTLVTEECCNCGTPFAIEATLHGSFRRHGTTFYCPNGHAQSYTKSIESQLKEEKQAREQAESSARWWKEQAEGKAAELKETKAKLSRTENRIKNGVCPCCHRSYVSLARHMKTKHPNYPEE